MGSINYNILLVINVVKWVIIERSHGEEYRIVVRLRERQRIREGVQNQRGRNGKD